MPQGCEQPMSTPASRCSDTLSSDLATRVRSRTRPWSTATSAPQVSQHRPAIPTTGIGRARRRVPRKDHQGVSIRARLHESSCSLADRLPYHLLPDSLQEPLTVFRWSPPIVVRPDHSDGCIRAIVSDPVALGSTPVPSSLPTAGRPESRVFSLGRRRQELDSQLLFGYFVGIEDFRSPTAELGRVGDLIQRADVFRENKG